MKVHLVDFVWNLKSSFSYQQVTPRRHTSRHTMLEVPVNLGNSWLMNLPEVHYEAKGGTLGTRELACSAAAAAAVRWSQLLHNPLPPGNSSHSRRHAHSSFLVCSSASMVRNAISSIFVRLNWVRESHVLSNKQYYLLQNRQLAPSLTAKRFSHSVLQVMLYFSVTDPFIRLPFP